MRRAAALAGLACLALSGLLRRDSAALFADAGRLHVALGRSAFALPVWAVVAGLLAVAAACVLTTRTGRALARAGLAPGQRLRLAFVAALLGFSLVPWEYSWTRPSRTHLVLYTVLSSLGAGLIVFGAWPWLEPVGRSARNSYERLMRLGRTRFLLLCAGLAFAAATLASMLVFERIPHVQDSIAQLFQARIFAAGRLWLDAPPFAEFFDYGHTILASRWYSVYPFLHSLILAPGVLAGAPWLVNPLLGAAFTVTVWWLGREAADERVGRGAALLACASPWLWAMSGEYMNHASSLVLLTCFLALGLRALRTARPGAALLSGILLGLAACVRPLTALAFGAPLVAYAALRGREPGGARRAGLLLLGCAGGGALLLAYNALTNGSPFLFGYVAKYGPGHELGFGRSGWGAAHTPLRGLLNIGHDLNMLNRFVLEWPAPALLLTLLPFLRGTRDRRDWLLLASLLALPAAYFFYWSHGVAFGPRFLYDALGPVLVLVARGLGPVSLPVSGAKKPRAYDFAARAVPLALVFALVAGLPPLVSWYRGYWGVDGRLLRAVKAQNLQNALVFTAELGDAFNANALKLDGPVVYARDLGPLNPALARAFPGRQSFVAAKGGPIRPVALEYNGSGLAATLAALEAEARARQAGYRCLFWPLRDAVPAGFQTRVLSYHDYGVAAQSGRMRLEDCLPALALWVDGDPRDLGVFCYLERSGYFEAGGVDFRQVAVVRGGRVFDIRPAR